MEAPEQPEAPAEDTTPSEAPPEAPSEDAPQDAPAPEAPDGGEGEPPQEAV